EPPAAARRLVSAYEGLPWTGRFRQVAECIALTSVFTTLRYYPGNRQLFVDRLLRYARTIPCGQGSTLVFEWVTVVPRVDRFAFVPTAEYAVNLAGGTVEETALSDAVSVRSSTAASPMHEAARPGSSAPARR